MLQAWFAATGHRAGKDPYFLYAASNVGSLIALLAYPILIEPHFRLALQSRLWTAAFGLLVGLTGICAVALWRSPRGRNRAIADETSQDASSAVSEERITFRMRLRWVVLALVPSSLLLGVTTHISTDIAAVPLLWIIPLTLYLLTFVLVFARWQLLPHRWMLRMQSLAVVVLAACYGIAARSMLWHMIGLHLAVFFLTAMVCHGELAASRPRARHLTEFYLWMSLGGVLGGIFNAIIAPLVFPLVIEYPLMLVVACALRPASASTSQSRQQRWLDLGFPAALVAIIALLAAILARRHVELSVYQGATVLALATLVVLSFVRRPLRFGLGVGALVVVDCLLTHTDWPALVQRNFFGVELVRYDADNDANVLLHGTTNHGMQYRAAEDRGVPLTYYGRESPITQVIQAMQTKRWLKEIGVIGLGTGTLAAYGQPGQRITFYEINPVVVRIARDERWFSYLADSKAQIDVVLGDARLTLAGAPPHRYDLLVLDAFSSDAIPMHLLTREALRLYLDKLAYGGVIAMHITNRYLYLAPILARLAQDAGLACRDRWHEGNDSPEDYSSHWVMMSRRADVLAKLTTADGWNNTLPKPRTPLWTDDFSNILSALGE
jgi:spermidine synthase